MQRVGASSTRARGVRADESAFGVDTARAIELGGRKIAGLGEDLTKKENTRKLNEARTGVFAALKEAEFEFEDDQDFETLSDRFGARSKEIREQFSQGLRGDTLESFNLIFENAQSAVGLNVRSFARSGIRKRGVASFATGLDQLSETVASATNDAEYDLAFGLAREMMADGVEARYFDQATGQATLDKWLNGVRRNQANNMILNDPDLAVEVLEADELDGLRESDRLSLLKEAKRQARIAENERRRAAKEQQALLRGQVAAGLKDELASLSLTGQSTGLVTADQIRAAYADEPGRAEGILQQIDEAAQFFEVRQEVALTDFSDDMRILQEQAPEGQGFAVEAERHRILVEAVKEKRKALASDPAGYLFMVSPGIAAAYQNAEDGPQTRAAIDTMLQEQERLGLPRHGQRALSDGQGKAMSLEYAGQEDAQGRADWVRGQAELYGEHWPRVYGELVQSGLPGGAAVLAGMTGPGQARAAQAMAEAQDVGAKDLKAAIGTDVAGDVEDAVRSELAAFEQSLAKVPGGAGTANLYRKETNTLAMLYAQQGADPATAAAQAASDVVNSQYEFLGTYRVPAGVDPDLVQGSTTLFLDRQIADLDVVIPPSIDDRLSDEDARGQYLAAVRDKGYWVTNSDETGLLLMDEQGRTVMRRQAFTQAGRPIIEGDAGRFSEISITVTHPDINDGKPTNIPSVFDGKPRSEEEAVRRVVEAGGVDPESGRALPGFDTIEAAVTAARDRSDSLGATREELMPVELLWSEMHTSIDDISEIIPGADSP
ncbi:hypothetical protein HBA54_27705 [Pelagibius litoralis]|uniref:Uncharacterized protein n=1 Tax=Pelagibius litoralis TaxID=374515 RepID=A0A967F3L7_9PROT|nr:hypothetical protein [Pelagibius litoralis]